PLVEALMGRRAFGSSPRDRNSNSSGQRRLDIELSDRRKMRSDNRANMTDMKYLGSGAAELDSQESILRHDDTKAVDTHSADAQSINGTPEGEVPR
ncbi:integral membrane protein PTH11, partial [Fusarium mundagurra]